MKLETLIRRIGDPGITDEFCISAETPLNSEVVSFYLENREPGVWPNFMLQDTKGHSPTLG